MIAIELGKTLGCCHILHWRNSAESDRLSGNTNQAGFGFTEVMVVEVGVVVVVVIN